MPPKFTLPESLRTNPGKPGEVQEEIIVVFLGGPLCGETYRPLGINALWALIGALASLGEPLCFWIKRSMTGSGPIGAFAGGRFCIFDTSHESIIMMTAHGIDIAGSPKVTIDDQSYGMFYWVPESAMMPFEDLISVGNALLLSQNRIVRTQVGQRFDDWKNDRYSESCG